MEADTICNSSLPNKLELNERVDYKRKKGKARTFILYDIVKCFQVPKVEQL